jgi:dTDP-4-amino-4,6-dideoxygalactose transaminase
MDMNLVRGRAIPYFDYRRDFFNEEEDLIRIIRDAGRRGAFILQDDVSRFETNLAAFVGAKFAIGVGNCTDGLFLTLKAVGIGIGDEVIFCTHTMVATAAAIHFAGATPVPVDCGADHLIDPAAVEAAITPRTRAIMPTQLNGRTADMQALAQIARRHSLVIVEDAAQALGSRFRGHAAGTFGAGGAISFYPAKVLGCLGDGGAVLTDHVNIFLNLAQLHNHGMDEDGEVAGWGLNSRLDNIQAAILDRRLQRLPEAIERRRAIAALYRARLKDLEELTLPPGPCGGDHFDVFQNYEIEAARRDGLRKFLDARGIGTVLPWGGKAVHQWKRLKLRASLPFTEALFKRLLLLPMNASLADDQIHKICDAIRRFYRA